MIKPLTLGDPVLERISDAVVDRFRPRRIILFGSRARGDGRDDSDYDVVVELETTSPRESKTAVGLALHEIARIDVHIRVPGQIERRRDDPGTVDWDIAREGIVLYPPGEFRLSPLPRVVRERRPDETPASVPEWIRTAEVDVLVITNEMASEFIPWPAICFHAQQAAEKYLKALLVKRWIRPERTHDIGALVHAVRAAGYLLPPLDADRCKKFGEYGVEPRYPGDAVIPDEAAGRQAVELMWAIVNAAKAHLA